MADPATEGAGGGRSTSVATRQTGFPQGQLRRAPPGALELVTDARAEPIDSLRFSWRNPPASS